MTTFLATMISIILGGLTANAVIRIRGSVDAVTATIVLIACVVVGLALGCIALLSQL